MDFLTLLLPTFIWFVIVASFIHLIRLDYWWIRIWDFPHLQLCVLALVGLVAWIFLGENNGWSDALMPVGLSAALLYQAWLIYPYTPLHAKQVHRIFRKAGEVTNDKATIRLMIANVYMYNTRTPDVCQLIKRYKPDVFLILEGNKAWADALESVQEEYPFRLLHPLENTYGMLFYSRLPLQNAELRFLIQDDIPSIYGQIKLPSEQLIHFYGVHPMPPSPTEHYRSTERDAELLLVGKEARQQKGPVIVAGDLNDVAWSHTTRLFQRISGLLDPRVGRGLFSTFHARYFFLRWPLDHVFVSHHFRLRYLKRLPNCGSDHFPILVDLTYAPDPARAVDIPQPEGDDVQETNETIREAS